MIGLKRGIVKLVPFDRKWIGLFEKEKVILKNKLGGSVSNIQHIGSMSIP